MSKPRTYLIEGEKYTLDEILARCPHLTRTNAAKRLDCYAPTWAKLEAPLMSTRDALKRGRKIVDRAYKEVIPFW